MRWAVKPMIGIGHPLEGLAQRHRRLAIDEPRRPPGVGRHLVALGRGVDDHRISIIGVVLDKGLGAVAFNAVGADGDVGVGPFVQVFEVAACAVAEGLDTAVTVSDIGVAGSVAVIEVAARLVAKRSDALSPLATNATRYPLMAPEDCRLHRSPPALMP